MMQVLILKKAMNKFMAFFIAFFLATMESTFFQNWVYAFPGMRPCPL